MSSSGVIFNLQSLDAEAGIYIHIPFCRQACFYCDFHFSTTLNKKGQLVDALVIELQLRKEEFKNQTIKSIYFGGGTPSLLTIKELQLLMDTIHKNYKVGENLEITLEANPDDLMDRSVLFPVQNKSLTNKSVFENYRAIGINRLSIGVQSFFEDDLKKMNRTHSSKEAKACLEEGAQHFDNITIDLIYGIPNMNLKKWNENLETAFGLGVNHISGYALTVEPKTALDTFIKKGIYPPIDEPLALQHFNHLIEKTEEQGFVHYEISNFGKPGYFSKHNTGYWQGKPYLGIGPSAHSFNTKQRSWNVSNNSKYIQSIKNNLLPTTLENLSIKDRYNEYVMMGLRTQWGISLKKIATDFGENYVGHFKSSAENYINQDLLVTFSVPGHSGCIDTVLTTKKGKFLIDGIAADLFMI